MDEAWFGRIYREYPGAWEVFSGAFPDAWMAFSEQGAVLKSLEVVRFFDLFGIRVWVEVYEVFVGVCLEGEKMVRVVGGTRQEAEAGIYAAAFSFLDRKAGISGKDSLILQNKKSQGVKKSGLRPKRCK